MDSLTEEAYVPACPIDLSPFTLGHLSLMSHLSQNYMTTGGHCVQTDHCLVIHWTHRARLTTHTLERFVHTWHWTLVSLYCWPLRWNRKTEHFLL